MFWKFQSAIFASQSKFNWFGFASHTDLKWSMSADFSEQIHTFRQYSSNWTYDYTAMIYILGKHFLHTEALAKTELHNRCHLNNKRDFLNSPFFIG